MTRGVETVSLVEFEMMYYKQEEGSAVAAGLNEKGLWTSRGDSGRIAISVPPYSGSQVKTTSVCDNTFHVLPAVNFNPMK